MISIIIPPIPNLDLARGRAAHLLLSHLLSDRAYTDFYRREGEAGAYLILDNSAHEFTSGAAPDLLFAQAYTIGASEIVLPDVLFDGPGTVQRTREALEVFVMHAYPVFGFKQPRLMVVPQGKNPREFSACLANLVDSFFRFQRAYPGAFPTPPVIGLSKDYEMWPGGLETLLAHEVLPVVRDLNTQLHLLGWGRDLWAYDRIFKAYASEIRSWDSAKPIVYGLNGIVLQRGETAPPYPTRRETYFQDRVPATHMEAVAENIRTFDMMARLTPTSV